jgi:hypothetical protein
MLLTKKSVFFRIRSEIAHTLIERSRVSTAHPRVRSDDLLRAVRNGRWKLTPLEERDVETQVEHVLKTVVDVDSTFECVGHQCPGREQSRRPKFSHEILRPFDGICVEIVRISGSPHRPPAVGLRDSIQP